MESENMKNKKQTNQANQDSADRREGGGVGEEQNHGQEGGSWARKASNAQYTWTACT